jgi:cyclic beta-1,2-glucan synthetase
MDPAAALQTPIAMGADETVEIVFFLGEVESPEEIGRLLSSYANAQQVDNALASTQQWWDTKLGSMEVRTPVLSANLLLNRWLPYQTLSCRFWGRTGLHQSSGAYGFRDQLQDCLAFLYIAPELTRAHILTAAARQFPEGDVQHWWHPESGLGVRTRCSDDMLWLPFVVAHYIDVTADAAILETQIAFLDGAPLREDEHERVFTPEPSTESATLFEHCRRAIDWAAKAGPHGLPLMGAGDWNDGLNHVGIGGRGESTWLAWFECTVLRAFAKLAGGRGEEALAATWRDRADRLAGAMEVSGWDGDWYLRGFFDNGTPLGSEASAEARIDSLPQSWAVISGAGEPARARKAMESAQRMLVDDPNRLVLLFTPPFDHSEPHPGYIMGYPPGVRENGGQYTHGALWMALAWARLGDGNAAVRLLQLMNPVEGARDPEAVDNYRGEPYVVAADVSSSEGRKGRAGWTWYTGSAGWMYRVWIEEVLGFKLRGDRLTIEPSIPDEWDGFEIAYRYKSSRYEIAVRRSVGQRSPAAPIQLVDDGQVHQVTVWIQQERAAPTRAPEARKPQNGIAPTVVSVPESAAERP